MNISTMVTSLRVLTSILALSIMTASCTQQPPSERLKPLVDRYVRAWNTGDFTGLEEVVSSQFELRMTPRFDPVRSLDSLKSAIRYWRTAYPDFTITVDEVLYTTNAVTARWTIRATSTGPGVHPPTGKTVIVPGMSIIHVAAGKIVDEWISANDLYWLQQLGFTLSPPGTGK